MSEFLVFIVEIGIYRIKRMFIRFLFVFGFFLGMNCGRVFVLYFCVFEICDKMIIFRFRIFKFLFIGLFKDKFVSVEDGFVNFMSNCFVLWFSYVNWALGIGLVFFMLVVVFFFFVG